MNLQQLTITTNNTHANDLSNWLQLNNAISITIVDAFDEPIYEPPLDSIILWQDLKISALFESNVNLDLLINKLTYDFHIEPEYTITPIIYNPEDHLKQKNNFNPICFANKLWLYPYDTNPEAAHQDRCYINLEPGLAFGSGEHPTTTLCLEWLASNITKDNNHNHTVIDYGAGSGILSLAAIKLGIKHAIAVDNDPQAITATIDNAARNKISDKITAYLPEDLPQVTADYIIANILANPLIELAPTLIKLLNHGGTLILSGILNEQSDAVTLTYMNYGIKITAIDQKGAWTRIVGKKINAE